MKNVNDVVAVESTQTNQIVSANVEENQIISSGDKITGLSLIASAMQQENFDINVLKELVQMQHDMEDRDELKAFNRDFSEMMGEIPVIAKTGTNSHNGTKFAKLEDIVEIVRPILNKYGFSVTYKQDQQMIDGVKFEPKNVFCMMNVTCVLKHRLGHEESNSILLPIAMIQGQTPIQAMGMGSTYGRRYTLMQALNIATAGQDNDGSMADFVKTASGQKKSISDQRLSIAIEKAKNGKSDFMRDLLDRFELTEIQKDFVNGQLFAQVEETTEGE